jgi:hypothetical protein
VSVDTTCELGCSAGACRTDPCAGVTCAAPPPPTCIDTSTARTYASAGRCDAGACEYDHVDVDCPDGCTAGRCRAPACGATTCDAPPAPTCLSASRARTYAPLGRCVADTCSYQAIEVDCSMGCLAGACLPGSWTTELQPGLPSRTIVSVQMALDALNQVHIAACDGPGNVIYRHRDAFGWSETIVDSMLGSGCRVALALDSAGRPMISYYEPTNDDLRFAEQSGPGRTFMVSLVANSGDVGNAPSIAVDAMDRPHIGFADRSTPGMRVATRTGGSWTFETAVNGSTAASSTASSIAIGPDGRVHLVAGLVTSVAVPSGGYDQPPLHYAVRSGGWTATTISPDGLVLRRGLQLTPLGDARVLYGVVRPVGRDDELRYHSISASGARDEIVQHVSNFLDGPPIGMFGPAAEPRFVWRNQTRYTQRRTGGFWENVNVPLSFFSVVDVATGNDGRARFLQPGWSVVTPTACVPECSGRSCGADGCGGSCGACPAGLSCDPEGACGAWATQTVDLGVGANVDSSITAAATSTGVVHAAFHHGAANASVGGVPSAELYYVTNAGGAWSPSQSLLVGAEVNTRGIALSSAGLPLIARYVTWDIATLVGDGAGMFTPATVPGYASESAPFIVDESGDWHLMIDGGSSVSYARRTGTTWSTELAANPGAVDPRGTGRADGLSFAIDDAGRAHAIWIQTLTYTGQVSLQYSTNEGGSWTTTARVAPYTAAFGASPPQIVVDGAGVVHAIYVVSGTGLVHATRSGTAWSTETIPDGGNEYRAVADDDGALVVLTWGASGMTLRRREAAGWTATPIAQHGRTMRADIVFDGAGRSHIVSWERGSSTPPILRYATHP